METNNQTGDLNYTGPNHLTLIGAGRDTTVIEQVTDDRLFFLHGVVPHTTIRLEGMTLRGGLSPSAGGAIVAATARIELVDVTLRDSSATTIGGCLHRLRLSNDFGAQLERVQIIGYTAGSGGGAMYLEAPGDQAFSSIVGSRFEHNSAGEWAGGMFLSRHRRCACRRPQARCGDLSS